MLMVLKPLFETIATIIYMLMAFRPLLVIYVYIYWRGVLLHPNVVLSVANVRPKKERERDNWNCTIMRWSVANVRVRLKKNEGGREGEGGGRNMGFLIEYLSTRLEY